MDTLTKDERSHRMSLVRGKDTKPELIVRRLVHGLGFRYRLHVKEIPGCPDLVFPRLQKVIFVHGCFWHRHTNCRNARMPKSRLAFWQTKLNQNKLRDIRNKKALTRQGWQYLVIWECEVAGVVRLVNRIQTFLKETP